MTSNSGFFPLSALSGYVLYPQTPSQLARTRGLMFGSELARRIIVMMMMVIKGPVQKSDN